MSVITSVDHKTALESIGFQGAALEWAVSAGAKTRHESRVEATRKAAWEALEAMYSNRSHGTAISLRDYLSDGGQDMDGLALHEAWPVFLDLIGTGGPRGIGGFRSARTGAFGVLGKGRWHASDGGAWRGAAEEVAYPIRSIEVRRNNETKGDDYIEIVLDNWKGGSANIILHDYVGDNSDSELPGIISAGFGENLLSLLRQGMVATAPVGSPTDELRGLLATDSIILEYWGTAEDWAEAYQICAESPLLPVRGCRA